ncbi:MAG: arginine--tRNA ligase [Candidatus Didemnitutus sp.]|nr:arginine--tRNA ligase [Candidatus Didemnitutus sp.]
MDLPFHLAHYLAAALQAAAQRLGVADRGFQPEVRVADPAHGDYQANGALAFAKREKQNPRAFAQQLLDAVAPEVLAHFETSLAGPGFINFRLQPAALLVWLQQFASEEQLRAGAAHARANQTWVIDYSSPNTAKQMHVGHLRSAVIGEALCRLLTLTGARVIRDNHLGDWGTQFGKLIYGYKRWADQNALATDAIEELERIYKLGHAATPDGSPELDEARRELVKLQNGDPENVALWQKFSDVSLAAFEEIYQRLGIKFDHVLGESFYNDKVERVYRELSEAGIAEVSDGALVVFHRDHPRFKTQPFLVRKGDGASNYAATDLATALYRAEHFHADGIAILTDFRQADHFEQLFLTVDKWFAARGYRRPELHHVSFGAVTGEDGKALKTRDGGTIKLKALLNEAVERAFALVTAKSPDLPEAERRDIANVVGVGSVQYADLAQNRSSNYLFSWDKMLALDGNTAPYLLYAVTRVRSIFRKAGFDPAQPPVVNATPPETAQELALARKLVQFADAVQLATDQLRPHYLCLYLYELAGAYSAFYAADKVIVEDPAVRARRLLLCHRALITLETGLHHLGLRTLERM